MKIIFNKITIHNFLSFGHSEISLKDKSYCLVSGINNFKNDNAQSNGSGKSTWSSAICWALTGETIQGLSSNIKNINVDEDLCYVTLDFTVDNDTYLITRYKNPKSDLVIIKNSEDISGKGIRESEAILSKNLPDLTSQLIASIIILGQGLPFKFTDNSPSGRKDVLEKLSKSDFMIQDLKERITARQKYISDKIREAEDNILKASTEKSILEQQVIDYNEKLNKLKIPHNYTEQIKIISDKITHIGVELTQNQNRLNSLNEDSNNLSIKLTKSIQEKSNIISNETSKFNIIKENYFKVTSALNSDISALNNQILKLKSITDICPTCGQKLPNVIKPNYDKEEEQVNKLQEEFNNVSRTYTAQETLHNNYIKQISENFDIDINGIKQSLAINQQAMLVINSKINSYNNDYINLKNELSRIELEKSNLETNIKNIESELDLIDNKIKKLNNNILYNNNEKVNLNKHNSILTNMNSLVKRDFRGYLLSSVIEYISSKAKEYSKVIFNTENLDFKLSGNNIDISYCDKSFENLSGGEKQKVDLIIQLAIRDMMQQYLNFSSNILVLDEIFDQLDMIGCNNVLNLILNKFNDIESMFIISHRANELEIPYDSEMIVIKNEQGVSHVVCR